MMLPSAWRMSRHIPSTFMRTTTALVTYDAHDGTDSRRQGYRLASPQYL